MDPSDRQLLRLALERGFLARPDLAELEHAMAREPSRRPAEFLLRLGLMATADIRDLEQEVTRGTSSNTSSSASAGSQAPSKASDKAYPEETAEPSTALARAGRNRRRTMEFFGAQGLGDDSQGAPAPGPAARSAADPRTMDFDARLVQRHAASSGQGASPPSSQAARPDAGGSAQHTIDFDAKLAALEQRHRKPRGAAVADTPSSAAHLAPPATGSDRTIDFEAKLAALERKHRRPEATEPPAPLDREPEPSRALVDSIDDSDCPTIDFDADSFRGLDAAAAGSRGRADRPPDAGRRGAARPPAPLLPPPPPSALPTAMTAKTAESGGTKRFGPLKSTSGAHARPPEVAGPPDPLVGQTVGGCRIDRFLGRGGMGAVYLANQLDLDRQVAFKVLSEELTQDPQQVDQFFREARALARLEHPNIVTIFNVGKEDKIHFLLMQLVTGGNLEEWLAARPRPEPDDACALAAQIARGLAEAHKKGIVHRDIKPANVLVAPGPTLKITDFGLARMDDEAMGFGEGRIVGTPYFMAPEQIDGRRVDPRTDIYALGATLYYMLTGRHPFEGDSAVEVLLMHVNDPLVPPREVEPNVPDAVSRIVCKMMAKDPDARYANLEQALKDIEAARQGQTVDVQAPVGQTGLAASPVALLQGELRPIDLDALMRTYGAPRPRGVYLATGVVAVALVVMLALAFGPLRGSLSVAAAAAQLVIEAPSANLNGGAERVPLDLAERLIAQGRLVEARDHLERVQRDDQAIAGDAQARLVRLAEEAAAEARVSVERSRKHVEAGDPGAAIQLLVEFPRAKREVSRDADRAVAEELARARGALAERGLAFVEAGGFRAGEGDAASATPLRDATTRGFYTELTEVSNRRFQAFVRATGAEAPRGWHQGGYPPGEDELPVHDVTWAQAAQFARWAGGRLPTPLEWERAASWDPDAQQKRAYPWGDAPQPDACNFAGNPTARRRPLAPRSSPKDKSAYGIFDLGGNVSEWAIGPHPQGDRAPAPGLVVAVVMGGAFATEDLRLCRATFFSGPYPDDLASPAVGVRVVYDRLPAEVR